jgi:hypothetical protein
MSLLSATPANMYPNVPLRPDEHIEILAVPISSIKVSGINPPDWGQLQDDGAGSTGVYTYLFDDTLDEEAFFSFSLPYGRVPGTPVNAFLRWCSIAGGAGNVLWKSERTFAIDGVPVLATVASETLSASPGVALIPVVETITPDPARLAQITPEAEVFVRMWRAASDGTDTLVGDVALLSVHVAYLSCVGRKADNGVSLSNV